MYETTLESIITQQDDLDAVTLAAGETMEFTMESMISFEEFFKILGDSITGALKSMANYHDTAAMDHPTNIAGMHSDLDNMGLVKLRSLEIYRVPKQSSINEEYLKELHAQIDAIHDIEQRLYLPALKWLAGVVNDTDRAEKPWVDRKLGFADTKKLQQRMAGHYQSKASRTDDNENIEFINIYPSLKSLYISEKIIYDLYEKISNFNLDNILTMEHKIIEKMNVLLEMSDDPEEEFVFSRANKVQMAKVFRAMALETEYATSVLFQANQAIGAWNNTIDILKKNI
ncbi:hypothetical protein [Vibrio phage BONAISHI]|nr:hypothetical protein [Vibrio phage BONAISHI]